MEVENRKVRVDKYLWSIRVFKTRSLATDAINASKVKQDGNPIKASKMVQIGDTYEIKTSSRKWIIKVVGIIENRVSYDIAQQHYIDITPIEEKNLEKPLVSSFHTGKRLSKIGHPTKKQRRDLNDWLDNDAT